MAVNKVVLGENTLIDLTGDTVSADKLSKGITAHNMAGEPIVGTMEAGGGGTNYTFTNGLTETDGTVSWDLNDRIKAGSGNYTIILGEPNSNTISSGNNNIIKGYEKVTGSNNIVLGWNNNVSGESNVIKGQGNSVQAQSNIVFSNSNSLKSGSFNMIAGGNFNSAKSNCNIILGEYCDCDGGCSLVVGGHVNSRGAYQIVTGKYNINDSGSGWSLGNFSFIIGNGTSDTSRSNAYTLDWQGNGTFAGTVSSATGADYAEYFEWKDGNPNNEDRVGYIVTLDGDKIVKANTGDDVLGICSGTAMVLGDSAEWNWSKRYLTDDFGRIIYEDYDVEHEEIKDENTGKVIKEAWTEHIHAPKENPAYDPSKTYIKRADRPEWQIVGMMGKLYVRDDGSCVVNGYADVKDGIATKANGKTNMRVMERVTDNIVRVLMK